MAPIGIFSPHRSALTPRSDLRPMVLRMITMNSLAAFTTEVSRLQGPNQARGAASSATPGTAQPPQPSQRKLEALPAAPSMNLPRGSLLDLRV